MNIFHHTKYKDYTLSGTRVVSILIVGTTAMFT